jgi:hypothetical protein
VKKAYVSRPSAVKIEAENSGLIMNCLIQFLKYVQAKENGSS